MNAKLKPTTAKPTPRKSSTRPPRRRKPKLPSLTGPQRQFCEGIVSGLPATHAYAIAYPDCSPRSAKANAPRLHAQPAILAEIAALRAQADAQAGSAVMNLVERRKFLARIVRARCIELPDNSDLWIVKKTSKGIIEYRFPDKLRALLLDTKLAGDESAPEPVDTLAEFIKAIRKDKPPTPPPPCAEVGTSRRDVRDIDSPPTSQSTPPPSANQGEASTPPLNEPPSSPPNASTPATESISSTPTTESHSSQNESALEPPGDHSAIRNPHSAIPSTPTPENVPIPCAPPYCRGPINAMLIGPVSDLRAAEEGRLRPPPTWFRGPRRAGMKPMNVSGRTGG